MGRNKKKFVEKDNSTKFVLLHRSQQDAEYGNEGASDFVLYPMDGQKERSDVKNANGKVQLEDSKDHVNSLGFVNDGYNYEQHLLSIGEGAQFMSATGVISKVVLPPEALASTKEEKDRLLEAVTITEDCMEADMRAALFNPEKFDSWDLNDDFVTQAAETEIEKENNDDDNDEDSDIKTDVFDYEAHIARMLKASEKTVYANSEINEKFPKGEDEDDESGSEYGSDMESFINEAGGVDEQQRIVELDFEKTLEEYDSDECGELEDPVYDESMQGQLTLDNDDVVKMMEDFLVIHERDRKFHSQTKADAIEHKNLEIKKLLVNPDGTPILQHDDDDDEEEEFVEGEDSGDEDYMPEYLKSREVSEFDCESIVSTYSNIENHPMRINDQKKKGLKKKKQNKNNNNDDDDDKNDKDNMKSEIHFLQSKSSSFQNELSASSLAVDQNNKKIKETSPILKHGQHKLSINNKEEIEIDIENQTKITKNEKSKQLKQSRAIELLNVSDSDEDELEGGSSDYLSEGSSAIPPEFLDMSDESSSYTSSSYSVESQESQIQWAEFQGWADEENVELKRVKRMVAKLRTRKPLMGFWDKTAYTVREDFMARLIQRCFLRKLRGRAFASFFDPDGAAGLNVDKLDYDEDVSLRPMLLTSHVVKGTNIRYMVKMGGGVPTIYFKKLKELHRANPQRKTFPVPELPPPKKTSLFIDLSDVSDALILADGSIESTLAVLKRRGSTDIDKNSTVLSNRSNCSLSFDGGGVVGQQTGEESEGGLGSIAESKATTSNNKESLTTNQPTSTVSSLSFSSVLPSLSKNNEKKNKNKKTVKEQEEEQEEKEVDTQRHFRIENKWTPTESHLRRVSIEPLSSKDDVQKVTVI